MPGKEFPTFNGNIYLVGFMGAGKSTIGKILARELNRPFIDTDELIEKKSQKSIAEIFRTHGERHFRQLETEVLHEISCESQAIVALGGGAILKEENRRLIQNSGISIYLAWDFNVLLSRIWNNPKRPLVENEKGEQGIQKLKDLFAERETLYKKSDMVIKCTLEMSPQQITGKIVANLKEQA